jgi:hypothetical protein
MFLGAGLTLSIQFNVTKVPNTYSLYKFQGTFSGSGFIAYNNSVSSSLIEQAPFPDKFITAHLDRGLREQERRSC